MLLISIITAMLFPRGRSYQFSDLRIGDVYIGEEVIAPFDFPINKTEEQLKLDVDAAKKRVAPVFIRNDSLHTAQITRLSVFFNTLKIIRDSSAVDDQKREILASFLGSYDINPAEETLSSLLQTGSHRRQSPANAFDKKLEKELSNLLNDLFAIGVLDKKKDDIVPGKGKISIINPDNELLENIDFYYDMDGARHLLKEGTEKLSQNRYHHSIS
ncbi:hypothetical protein KAH55_02600, partial [bacterium]|nr:hypothetical protein [bacterium]